MVTQVLRTLSGIFCWKIAIINFYLNSQTKSNQCPLLKVPVISLNINISFVCCHCVSSYSELRLSRNIETVCHMSIDMIMLLDNGNTWFRILMSRNLVTSWHPDMIGFLVRFLNTSETQFVMYWIEISFPISIVYKLEYYIHHVNIKPFSSIYIQFMTPTKTPPLI